MNDSQEMIWEKKQIYLELFKLEGYHTVNYKREDQINLKQTKGGAN